MAAPSPGSASIRRFTIQHWASSCCLAILVHLAAAGPGGEPGPEESCSGRRGNAAHAPASVRGNVDRRSVHCRGVVVLPCAGARPYRRTPDPFPVARDLGKQWVNYANTNEGQSPPSIRTEYRAQGYHRIVHQTESAPSGQEPGHVLRGSGQRPDNGAVATGRAHRQGGSTRRIYLRYCGVAVVYGAVRQFCRGNG